MTIKTWLKGYMEYILFDSQSFNILLGISYIMAMFVCGSLLVMGIILKIYVIVFIFGALSLIAAWNLWRFRNIFKAFKRKQEYNPEKDGYMDITVADTINTFAKAKEEEIPPSKESKEEEKWN